MVTLFDYIMILAILFILGVPLLTIGTVIPSVFCIYTGIALCCVGSGGVLILAIAGLIDAIKNSS